MPDLQATVREKLESAEIEREPFPHMVVPDLLPDDLFHDLEVSIPPMTKFNKGGTRANVDVDKELRGGSEDFCAAWGRLRDELVRGPLTEVLTTRFEADIRDSYAETYSPEIADEIMAGGLVIPGGRVMMRKAGYILKPHSDPARFGLTFLLYFSTAEDDASGALCLFEPERTPEVMHTTTYYPTSEEKIEVMLAKMIPISKNLFVAFVNGPRSLHGVRVERRDAGTPRLAYQSHVLPKHDPADTDPDFLTRLGPAALRRWEWWAAKEEARGKRPSAS